MNRLFIILALVTGISAATWAYRHFRSGTPDPTHAAPFGGTPACCQKSPSRTTLLQAKPSATPVTQVASQK
jgi:hypothetical protein